MSTADETTGFGRAPETAAPTPVATERSVAHFDDDGRPPAGLFPEEHVAEVNSQTVVRAGFKCPTCGSCLFLHPDSVVPRNSVMCFSCSWSALSVVWWMDTELEDYRSA